MGDPYRPRDFLIELDTYMTKELYIQTLLHELTHLAQWIRGSLRHRYGKLCYCKTPVENWDYWHQPHEVEAREEERLYNWWLTDTFGVPVEEPSTGSSTDCVHRYNTSNRNSLNESMLTRKCSKCGAEHPLTEEFLLKINPPTLVVISIFVLSVRSALKRQDKARTKHINLLVVLSVHHWELHAIIVEELIKSWCLIMTTKL